MIYFIALIVLSLSIFLDQYTKYLATTHLKSHTIPIIEDVFELEYLENTGAAFGLLKNQQLLFLVVGVITLILITYVYVRLPKQKHFIPLRICMIFITAGAVGNMIDRIRFGYVVDFLSFTLINFPIFNVADIYATLATVGLIILFLFYYKDADIDYIFSLFSKNNTKQE